MHTALYTKRHVILMLAQYNHAMLIHVTNS